MDIKTCGGASDHALPALIRRTFISRIMRPQLTYNTATNQWETPLEWGYWDWMIDPENYPDPTFSVFAGEYDYEFIDKRGVLFKYKNHIYGKETEVVSSTGKTFVRKSAPKAYQYALFAKGAVRLINNPALYRSARYGSLNGSFVINYVNSVHLSELIPSGTVEKEEKLYNSLANRKYLISTEFGALMARTFNLTSGIEPKQYGLKTEKREDKLSRCPACEAIYYNLSRDFVLPKDSDYSDLCEKMTDQAEYKQSRDEHG